MTLRKKRVYGPRSNRIKISLPEYYASPGDCKYFNESIRIIIHQPRLSERIFPTYISENKNRNAYFVSNQNNIQFSGDIREVIYVDQVEDNLCSTEDDDE